MSTPESAVSCPLHWSVRVPDRGVTLYVCATFKSTTISRPTSAGSLRIDLTAPRGRSTKTPVFFHRLGGRVGADRQMLAPSPVAGIVAPDQIPMVGSSARQCPGTAPPTKIPHGGAGSPDALDVGTSRDRRGPSPAAGGRLIAGSVRSGPSGVPTRSTG